MFSSKQVKARLKMLGYDYKVTDAQAVDFYVEKVSSSIKNKTHRPDVPAGLEYVATEMAVGEFLKFKKTFTPDDIAGLDLETAVKQIQEGDTNTVFAVGEGCLTAEQRLDNLISYFLSYGQNELTHYRRLVW